MQKLVILKDNRVFMENGTPYSVGALVEVDNNTAHYYVENGYAELYVEKKEVKKKVKMMEAGKAKKYVTKG